VSKFDSTKPVRTRTGRPARIVAHDLRSADGYSLVAIIGDPGDETAETYSADGRYFAGESSGLDLVNA
jgi:hypothetical protein